MTIRDLESKYEELHTQLLRGDLEEEDFRREVQQIQYVDELGRRWRIGWYTGKWYREEQGEWTPGHPREADLAPAAQGAPGASPAPGADPDRTRRPFTFWLAGALAVLLLAVAVVLVAGWAVGWWAQEEPGEAVVAHSTQPAATVPPSSMAPPTITRLLPTDTARPSATPSPTATARPSATPTVTATASPTPSATASAVAATTPAAELPLAPGLSGRIYYPAYDPQARTFHIYVYDIDTGTREILVRQASQPAISPDGRRLAYRSWDRAQRSIRVRELDDGHTWTWVNYVEAARPSWSPDSENIVFPSQHESDRQWRIYRTIGTTIELFRRHGGDLFGRVPVSLASGEIAYWECPLNQCGLYRMKGDGSSPVRLTEAEYDTAPAASPDGRNLAFMSNFQGGNWEIQITTAYPGRELSARRLTTDPGRDGLPAWSPDGRWIAFVTDRDGAWSVWVMRPDGSGTQKLFELDAPFEGPIDFVASGDQHGWLMETLAWGP
ncbi:MAG: PD40 domain-containing protein [Anaerolineae bacterium]|nr:PD40 domain-containing protein [Anaerolineae bacterium]